MTDLTSTQKLRYELKVNYRIKMAHHIGKAEEWQRHVDALESAALDLASRESEGAIHSTNYRAAAKLRDNFEYKQAVANRNAHQAQANMYAVAAIAMAQ